MDDVAESRWERREEKGRGGVDWCFGIGQLVESQSPTFDDEIDVSKQAPPPQQATSLGNIP